MAGFQRLGGRLAVVILLIWTLSPSAAAGDPGGLSVTLEWDPNPEPDLQGYFLYRSEQQGTGYVRLNTTPQSATSFVDTGLIEGTSYYYVCTAVNTSGIESGYSNEVAVLLDPANSPPQAVADAVSLPEDQPAVIDVLANDADPDSDPLAITAVTQPTLGTVTTDGALLSYAPAPDFNGLETFSYTVADGRGGSSSATVDVTVLPVNDAPVASPDFVVLTTEATVSIAVLDNDVDPDGDTLALVSVTAAQGTVSVEGSMLSYTPPGGFTGIDSFQYTVSDAAGATAVGDVTVDVGNRAPDAVDDTATVDEDGAVEIDVLGNDLDPDGDPLSIASFSQPAEGFVNATQSGLLRYSSAVNYNGTESFSYTVSDGRGQEATAMVTVTVAPVNDPPEALPDQIVVDANGSATIDVLANDSDPDGDSLIIESAAGSQGSISIAAGLIEYSAPQDFSGIDTFTYVAADGNGGVDSALVRVKVDVENRPPTAVDDWSSTLSGQSVSLNLTSNDTDPDEDLLQIVSLGDPADGSLILGSLGWVRFTPDPDFSGTAQFAYTITDGEAESTGQVTVEVRDLPGSSLLFPVRVGSDQASDLVGDPLVGIALLNPGDQTEIVGFRTFDTAGREIGSEQLDIPLPAGGQDAFLTRDLPQTAGASSLQVESGGAPLQGFFSLVDESVQRMDAIGARPTPGRRLYLHQLKATLDVTTVVSLINPSTQIAEIQLELFTADGESLAVAYPVLAPLGSMRGSLEEIFGELPELFDAWIRLQSDVAVIGFSVQASESSFSAEAAREAVRSDQQTAAHFYFSRVNSDRSRLRLLNIGGAAVRVVVEAFDDTSGLLATDSFNIDPGELLSEDVDTLLDFSAVPGDEVSGYLRIQTLSFLGGLPSVIGSMTFSTFEQEASTALPLATKARDATLFPHVAQSNDASLFTGLALVNPADQTTVATIEAFDADGRLSARRDVKLGPGHRLVEMLNSDRLFGADFEQLGGHIRVRSATPIFTLALMGSGPGRFLSAIEGQAAPVQ